MRLAISSFCLLLVSTSCYNVLAQQGFGIEFSYARVRTHNAGKLESGSYGYGGYWVNREQPAHQSCMAAGITYDLDEKHGIKLSFAQHRNGLAIDLTTFDDVYGLDPAYTNVHIPYEYYQLVPAYTYRINAGRISIPLEIGVAANMLVNEQNIFFIPVKKFTFDAQCSGGVHFRFKQPVIIGMNAVYMRSLGEYQAGVETGTYKPVQFGWEGIIKFSLAGKKQQ